MSISEMTELLSLPIILVAGFVLIVVLALLMVILRKETTYEDVQRERERKLGDSAEGGQEKNVKPSKKKGLSKPKKVESALSQPPQSDPSVSETNTSEEEISQTFPPTLSSPKVSAKSKKSKQKQPVETSSLPSDFASVEEITVVPIESALPPIQVSESLPPLSSDVPTDGFSEVSSRKKNRSKTKKLKEEFPVSEQNGDINWSETNGHDSDQVLYLTTQLDKATVEKNEAIHSKEDLSGEVRFKNSEIQKLKQDLQAHSLSSGQQLSNLKKDCNQLKTQLQTAQMQTQANSQMQEELDRRKTNIDSLKTQMSNLKGQFDTQLQQLKATTDKKEVERARILQNRDATQSELEKVNASYAELTSNHKKLERQLREAAANSSHDAALEQSLSKKTVELLTAQKSLESAERAGAAKENLAMEVQQQQRTIAELRDELSAQVETPVTSGSSSEEVVELQEKVNEYESKIEDLSRSVSDWEGTVSTLKGEMSSLRTESSGDGDVEQLRRDLAEKESQILSLTALVETAQEELKSVGDIRSEFEEMKRQTEELQLENELQRNSISQEPDEHPIAKLVSSHAILHASVSQYGDVLDESKRKNDEMKNDLESSEKKVQEKDGELTTSKDENKIIQETLDKFKKKNNELRENVWKMKDVVKDSEKLAEKETKSVQYKVEDFLAQVFPNIRAYGEDFNSWLEKMKLSANDYLSKLEDNKSSSETDSELKEKVKELTEKEELQSRENEDLKTTIRDTEVEVLLLQSQVEEELEKLQGSLTSEQRAGHEKQAIIGEKENELSENVKHLQTLSQENVTLKRSIVPELEKSLKDKEGEIHELTYQVDSISNKSAKLEDDLASSIRQSFDNEELTNSLQAENLSLFGLSEINQSYKKELAEAKAMIRTLQASRPSTQADGREDGRDALELKEELESLKQENDSLQQKLREMETHTAEATNINNNNAAEVVKQKKTSKPPKITKKTPSTAL